MSFSRDLRLGQPRDMSMTAWTLGFTRVARRSEGLGRTSFDVQEIVRQPIHNGCREKQFCACMPCTCLWKRYRSNTSVSAGHDFQCQGELATQWMSAFLNCSILYVVTDLAVIPWVLVLSATEGPLNRRRGRRRKLVD